MPPRKHIAPSLVKTEPDDVDMEREWDELDQDELDDTVQPEVGVSAAPGSAAASTASPAARSSISGKWPGAPRASPHGAKGTKTPKSPKSPKSPKIPKVAGGGKDGSGSKDSGAFAVRAAALADEQPGEWTPAKRELFFERIVELGYKHADLGDIADKLGLNRRQLINQLTTGRKGNFRDRAVRCVKGDDGDK